MLNKDKDILENNSSDSTNNNSSTDDFSNGENNVDDKEKNVELDSEQDSIEEENNKEKDLDKLQKEFDELNDKYSQISNEYTTIKNNYDLVNTKLKNLLSHYEKLESNYSALKQDLNNHKLMQTNSARIKLVEQLFGLHEKLLLILEHNKDSSDENILLLKMINHEIESVYNDWDVEKYAPNVGELYDSSISKIVNTVAQDDENMKNKISRVVYMGYKMQNKIIKIAEVEIFI